MEFIERAINTSNCAGLPSKVTPCGLLYGRPRDPELDIRQASWTSPPKNSTRSLNKTSSLNKTWSQTAIGRPTRNPPQNYCDHSQASSKIIAESDKVFANLYDRTLERQASIRAKMAARYATKHTIRLFDVGEYVEVRLPVGTRSSLDTNRF